MLWLIAAAVVVVVVAFVAGRSLRGKSETASAFDLSAPAYEAAASIGVSKGRFSGAGATAALEGRVIQSGSVSSAAAGAITLDSAAGPFNLRTAVTTRVWRLEAVTRNTLRAGDAVLVSKGDGNAAVGILRIVP
jgi:hypothetical protein